MKKRVLVVEDDVGLARVLRDNLCSQGFEVDWISDGDLVEAKAKDFAPDLVLLDVMLPGKDGFQLCAALKQRSRTPVLILSARSQRSDTLRGLNLGADDYITKPFDLQELLARVRAVLRRSAPSGDTLVMGSVTINFLHRTARRGKTELYLTHREYELLQYLSERPGRVVHRSELLRNVWGYPDAPLTRAVDNAILRLRRKIEPDVHHPHFIHTIVGDGYSLTPEGRLLPEK
jgi:two-component system, OmpR family, response regulator MtrA